MQETLGGAGYRAAWFLDCVTLDRLKTRSKCSLSVAGKSQSKMCCRATGCVFFSLANGSCLATLDTNRRYPPLSVTAVLAIRLTTHMHYNDAGDAPQPMASEIGRIGVAVHLKIQPASQRRCS